MFTDYTVKAQEVNTKFARQAVETWIDGLRKQTELSQEVAQQLFGKAEEQADVYRSFFGQWGNVPAMRFPFAGLYVPLPEAGHEARRDRRQERRGGHRHRHVPHRQLR
jgi:hypothetical protein